MFPYRAEIGTIDAKKKSKFAKKTAKSVTKDKEEEEKEEEKNHCLSQSHHFKGLCVSSSNCANVCRTENFPGGECKTEGATRKCFCKRIC